MNYGKCWSLLICALTTLPLLSSAGRVGILTRDAYVVQTLRLDEYISASETYGRNSVGGLDTNLRIGLLSTELYLTASKLGESPIGVGLNSETSDGVTKLSPTLWQFDGDDDLQTRITPGARGNRYRVVTNLGGLAISNTAFYSETNVNGEILARGFVPEVWNNKISGGATVDDPYLNNFMQTIFNQYRPRIGNPREYGGFAGALQAGYSRNAVQYQVDTQKLQYNNVMTRVARPSDGGGIASIDTTASVQHFEEETAAREAAQKAIRQANRESSLSSRLSAGSAGGPPTGPNPFQDLVDAQAEGERAYAVELNEPPPCSPWGKRSLRARAATCPKLTAEDRTALEKPTSTVATRTGGLLRTFTSIGGRVVGLAGPAGLALLPVFIILDIVGGDWKAALWATGGVAAGVGADAAITSSIEAVAGAALVGASVAAAVIGVVVGAAVALLFIIFPGIFKEAHEPEASNITQIIQWKFFGDATHSGNEKCNENLKDNGQTPNCTVTYGAGAISSIFGWEIYDAATFLVAMNQGHAMSIPDMAANFTVYDYTNPSASANAIAVIDCGKASCSDPNDNVVTEENNEPAQIPCSVSSEGYKCSKPQFKLNRSIVTLPVINQKADAVHSQVESGDCKIVSDPIEGEVLYPEQDSGDYTDSNGSTNVTSLFDYFTSEVSGSTASNLTRYSNSSQANNVSTFSQLVGPWSLVPGPTLNYTGRPVSIACNLSRNIPDVLSPNYNVMQPNISINANSSTAEDPSYFVAPPKPQPFLPLTTDNATCLSSSKVPNTQICVPNGIFPVGQGAFGFKMDKVDTISFPSGNGTLKLNIEQITDSGGTDVTPDTEFYGNTKKDDSLSYSMSVATSKKDTFEITSANGAANTSPPPSFCVFSQPKYLGDVFCMGVGGTNLSSNLVNKIGSFTLGTGLAGWLYPGFYGNPLGLRVSTSVENITDLPYHTSGSFQGNLAAAWIFDATKTGNSGGG